MKKYTVLKLIGLALLTMVILVVISILEVTVYSYLIDPGKDQAYYDKHAELTAPYVSGIFGFLVMFFITRYWKKKRVENLPRLVFLLPLTYLLLDVIILIAAQVVWADFIWIFLFANAAKFLGSYLGYKLTKDPRSVSAV